LNRKEAYYSWASDRVPSAQTCCTPRILDVHKFVASPAYLPVARLVLEKEPDALAFMRSLNFSEQRRGSF